MNAAPRGLALPTAAQVAWADAELGVIIHFDMQVFEPDYEFRRKWGYVPDARKFNPTALDTDQWLATAKSAGATYAVLVAKHCSGFSLWPTKAHPYSVASSPWRGGQGDIVRDFIASCATYGLKPGIYASTSCNAYLRADNPGKVLTDDPEFLKLYSTKMEMQSGRASVWAGPAEQQRYNQVVETQLAELWGNYGRLFEIWFDGGALPVEQGGPDLIPLMRRLQPDAVVFGGPEGWPSLARFVGNERGEAPVPFWNATGNLAAFDGTSEVDGLGGDPDAQVWSPGEADLPNRCQLKAFQGGWFWRAGDERHLYSVDHLVERFFTSVARGTNMLIGMVIDPRGLVPEADAARFAEFGERLRAIRSTRIAQTAGEGEVVELPLPAGRTPAILELMEDIRHGERVRRFVVEARTADGWSEIWRGSGIGHKKLERFSPISASALRLRVEACAAVPRIRSFAAYEADPALFSVPMDAAQRSRPTIARDRAGLVLLGCSNPDLPLRYTTDGSEPDGGSTLYTAPFALRDGGTVKVFAGFHPISRSATVTAVFGIDRRDWKVVSVSLESPFRNEGNAGSGHLLDDDPRTYWHTYHADPAKSAPPHEAVLDMGRSRQIAAFTMTPRAGSDAAPDRYEFHLGQDGTTWTLAASGTFADLKRDSAIRLVPLARPMAGRYLRFVALHALDDVPFIAVAGLGIVPAG